MNIIALDIGNTTITLALFLENEKDFIETISGDDTDALREAICRAWDKIPVNPASTEHKRDGLIVASSVKPEWTIMVEGVCKQELDEKVKLIGRDVRFPIEMGVENPELVGTDRVVSAAAAFAVVEDAVVIADFGTAVTIDLVDEEGVFLGGVIAPGFELQAEALKNHTALLPKVSVTQPVPATGINTEEAIQGGLYYSAVGLLRTVTEEFATQIGRWPQLVVTGGSASIIKKHCDFVDSWVPDLAVRGVVMAYMKHVSDKEEFSEIVEKFKSDSKHKLN